MFLTGIALGTNVADSNYGVLVDNGTTLLEVSLAAQESGLYFIPLNPHLTAAELAQDLAQETFRIALERLRRRPLEDPAGLASFLRGIARNLATAERRKFARRRTDADPDALEQAPSPAPSQLSTVLQDEEAAAVRQLIAELPTDRDRQLLLRFYVAEEEKERICADLGLDSLHFNRVLFRARQRFKQLFERARAHPLFGSS